MRIRTLKPEWLYDESLAAVGSDARVLSIALILLADDYGNSRASLPFLAGQVFAFEDCDQVAKVRGGLSALAAIGFINVYSVRGQSYYHINNWDKHQRVDNAGKARVPGPEQSEVVEDCGDVESLAANRGESRRGNGVSRLDPDPDPDPDPDQDHLSSSDERDDSRPSVADRIFTHWTSVMGKPKSTKFNPKRKRAVQARLKDGYAEEDIRKAIDGCKASAWHMGDNDRHQAFNDLELICRNGAKLESFWDVKAPPTGKHRVGMAQVGDFTDVEETTDEELDAMFGEAS